MGGGFGHLTRIQTFIHTFQISDPFKIVTANHSAYDFFGEEQLLFIEASPQTTKYELADKIEIVTAPFNFNRLYIDTFPCGILGELTPETIKADKTYYLARRMIWDNYNSQIDKNPSFDHVYKFEPLENSHQDFITAHSKEIIDASLIYPSQNISFSHPIFKSPKPIWIIVHTTHAEELAILVDHAQDIAGIEKVDPQLVVLSDQEISLPDSAIWLHNQNPMDWYSRADKIFSAAGFNTWHQLKPWKQKHIVIPFKRRFDDQFWRASLNS